MPTVTQSQPPPSTSASAPPADDFSRLFAGLTSSNSSGRSVSETYAVPPPQLNGALNTPKSYPTRPSKPPSSVDPGGITPNDANYSLNPPLPSIALNHSVGQMSSGESADDLLNSILGVPPKPKPSQPASGFDPPSETIVSHLSSVQEEAQAIESAQSAPFPAPVVPIQQGQQTPSTMTALDLLSQWATPPADSPHLQKKPSKVGDATFAQAAAAPPSPLPHPGPAPHHQQPPFPLAVLPMFNGFGQISIDPIRDAMLYHVGHVQPGMMSKGQLVDHVVMLLQHNEQFVDDLWRSYLDRTKGGPG